MVKILLELESNPYLLQPLEQILSAFPSYTYMEAKVHWRSQGLDHINEITKDIAPIRKMGHD